jgi:L-glyceraldehyde 3-phosphate reductase
MAQTALAWILEQEGVTSTLVGASSAKQLMNNLCCINSASFSDEHLNILG